MHLVNNDRKRALDCFEKILNADADNVDALKLAGMLYAQVRGLGWGEHVVGGGRLRFCTPTFSTLGITLSQAGGNAICAGEGKGEGRVRGVKGQTTLLHSHMFNPRYHTHSSWRECSTRRWGERGRLPPPHTCTPPVARTLRHPLAVLVSCSPYIAAPAPSLSLPPHTLPFQHAFLSCCRRYIHTPPHPHR
jgi:hypothetical protein